MKDLDYCQAVGCSQQEWIDAIAHSIGTLVIAVISVALIIFILTGIHNWWKGGRFFFGVVE